MEEKLEAVRLEIGKLSLGKDDYLFIKFQDTSLSAESAWDIVNLFRKDFPELIRKTIFFLGDVEIAVVHKESNETRYYCK